MSKNEGRETGFYIYSMKVLSPNIFDAQKYIRMPIKAYIVIILLQIFF